VNGAGKTTLVSALLRGGPAPDRILRLPQELLPTDVARLADQLRVLEPIDDGRRAPGHMAIVTTPRAQTSLVEALAWLESKLVAVGQARRP